MKPLRGSAEYSIDSKGRLAIPARMRAAKELHPGSGVVLNMVDGCITVYPLPDWEIREEKVRQLSDDIEVERETKREILLRALDLDVDAQGRIALPKKYLDYADLAPSTTALVLGVDNRMEVWNPERHAQRQSARDQPFERMLERSLGGGGAA